jgi:hypothetical protein
MFVFLVIVSSLCGLLTLELFHISDIAGYFVGIFVFFLLNLGIYFYTKYKEKIYFRRLK